MELAEPGQLFARFAQDAKTPAAARASFELMVTDLVKVRHPDATSVEDPAGRDWGIDTFVGQLAGGGIRIWQSKFFLSWQDKSPQSQVRSSFGSAVKNADKNGFKIVEWTLVVPCVLHPDQLKWFQGWARRQKGKHKIEINIWDGLGLRSQLLNRDAEDVRREYFRHTLIETKPTRAKVPEVRTTANLAQFEEALFVRQLHEAGHVETDSSCAHFYATDALVRDLTAKGLDDDIEAMKHLHLEVHDIWEREFNRESAAADDDGRMTELFGRVTDGAAACDDPPGLPLATAHKKGTAHRLVEESKAGWVLHWRQIAEEHAAFNVSDKVDEGSGDSPDALPDDGTTVAAEGP